MDRPSRTDLGAYGEQLACRYLAEQGYTILDRNWRCARGEIDVVAATAGALVVCEVKTRSSELFGAPFEAVTRRKLGRLRRLAGLWIEAQPQSHHLRGDLRLDVISIVKAPGAAPRLEHRVGVS